jgi:hypothetical protein
MIKILAIILLSICNIHPLLGQISDNAVSGCSHPIESVKINPINPKSNEKYVRKAEKFLVFEEDFRDTVLIWVADKLISKRYIKTDEEGGFADRVNIKVKPQTKIMIKTVDGDCTQFFMKSGYKYVYIQRYKGSQWTVTYSNYRRGYY